MGIPLNKIEEVQLLQREYNFTMIKIQQLLNKELMSDSKLIADNVLTATDVKKLVYKQQPKAKFEKIRIGVAYYTFNVLWNDSVRLGFGCEIPIEDMGTADFSNEMEAKLLLRWLKSENVLYFEAIKTEEI